MVWNGVKIASQGTYIENGRKECLDDFTTRTDATMTQGDDGWDADGVFFMDPGGNGNNSNAVPISLVVTNPGDGKNSGSEIEFTVVILDPTTNEQTNCVATYTLSCGDGLGLSNKESFCRSETGAASLSTGAKLGIGVGAVLVFLLIV